MYLILDKLVKKFTSRGGAGEVIAVNGISLDIAQGELVTLLGPSGCGKTTTLRLIAGFEFPTQGRILLDGKEINDLPPHKRDMSMVFQSYAIFPHLNVFENIAYGLEVKRRPQAEIKERVARVLDLVGLTGYENRAPHQLSGGQQQRVALARALVMEPKVLLMDEPLSNLDAKLREQMRTEIRRIQKQLGITSVYVTHDQTEAMTLSDRICIINNGRVEQVGTPQEIYQHPANAFVADFIGRANFLDARVIERTGNQVVVDVLGYRLTVPQPSQQVAVGQTVSLVLRPEAVELGVENGLRGTVRRAAYLGSVIDYDIEVGGQLIGVVVYDPRRKALHTEGEEVGLGIIAEATYLLPKT